MLPRMFSNGSRDEDTEGFGGISNSETLSAPGRDDGANSESIKNESFLDRVLERRRRFDRTA